MASVLLPLLLAGIQVPAATGPQAPAAGAATVPLSLWTNADWPNGLELGEATGISFGDYDADGWPDLFAHGSGNLWRNTGGSTWVLAADLDSVLPTPAVRYGSSFGDYDNDGLPDIGTEPRGGPNGYDTCFHLLKNLGGGPNFVDVAGDPAIVDFQPCDADSETIGWADVDGDGDLDMLLPIYPPNAGSIDNKFFHNRGPTGPGGAYRFTEEAATVGLLVSPGAARPEGVFFLDSDADGDLDVYLSGHLYQNLSALDAPAFDWLRVTDSGIRKRNVVDEGVFFLDYDMDGDFDLLMSYTGQNGLRLWEAYGDGSYFETATTIIEDYQNGDNFGLSVADWDGDGDLDFNAEDTFRANTFMETGGRFFELAQHGINPDHLRSVTGAWGDWDRDGDPDMAIGNGMFGSFLYRNDTWDATTPPEQRRDVRVRVVRDSQAVPRGLETEYGATVEVHVHGDDPGLRRRQIVSSAAGYLTQNEYALAFALPPDPNPDPAEDLRLDVTVDFPSLPVQGFHRVDRFVNPALGGLDLEALYGDRELTVYRSGAVRYRGCLLSPMPAPDPKLVTSAGGLQVPVKDGPLPDPVNASSADEWVGVEITTPAGGPDLLVKEIFLDGRPGPALACGTTGPANILLWDVSDPAAPYVPPFGALERHLDPRNRRGAWPVAMILKPGRTYRLVARVETLRATPIAGPVDHGSFQVNGGLHYTDPSPCDGSAVVAASVDPQQLWLAVRVAEGLPPWVDLGNGDPGLRLSGAGKSAPGAPFALTLTGAPAGAKAVLVAGRSIRCEVRGGVRVVPDADVLRRGLRADAAGVLTVPALWPASLAAGDPLFFQVLVEDPGAPGGVRGSNAVARVSLD